jgi:hypothetical protein
MADEGTISRDWIDQSAKKLGQSLHPASQVAAALSLPSGVLIAIVCAKTFAERFAGGFS